MARTFVLPEDEAGRQTGRGASFSGVLAYVAHSGDLDQPFQRISIKRSA